MSLVDLANQKQLPQFQHIDAETCEWIAANNPGYNLDGKINVSPHMGILGALRVDPAWFLEPRITNSLHGLRHLWRCAYYSLYLSSSLGLNDREAMNLMIAALLHDIRRENDQGDPAHGQRAAQWLRKNAQIIEEHMHIQFEPQDVESMAAAIELHETPYEAFTADQKALCENHRVITDALKTLDALDRYRMPKLKWWIDDSHLKIVPPDWLKQVAFDLVLSSEQNFLKDQDSRQSIFTAINEGKSV